MGGVVVVSLYIVATGSAAVRAIALKCQAETRKCFALKPRLAATRHGFVRLCNARCSSNELVLTCVSTNREDAFFGAGSDLSDLVASDNDDGSLSLSYPPRPCAARS